MKKITEMTLEEKIGQLLVAGFAGEELTQEDINHFEKHHIGNFIYFARNIKNKPAILALSQQLHEISELPPFITVDQEGGMVTRITNVATCFPGNMAIGAVQDPKVANQIGSIMGSELLNLGINFNLAPVLDVNNNAKNPVIGVRSYGDNPEHVADFGCECIKGLQSQGVIATAKHFPGHGDTAVDSHHGLPVIHHDLDRLEKVEFVPFKRSIEAGVEAIMSAHIVFTKLTTDNLPGTLSKQLLTGVLRERFGYEGLIITDCLEMQAIADKFGTVEGAVLAIDAGADLLCVCHTRETQAAVCVALKEAVESGRISQARIDEAVTRILAVKEKYNHKDYQKYLNQLSADTLAQHQEFSKDISRKSVTLVKGELPKLGLKTLVVAPLPQSLNAADEKIKVSSFAHALSNEIDADPYIIPLNSTEEDVEKVMTLATQYEQVIIGTYNVAAFPTQKEVVTQLLTIHKDLVAVALRNPYDIELYKDVTHYMTAYEYSELAVQSLVNAIKNGSVGEAVCPVTLEM